MKYVLSLLIVLLPFFATAKRTEGEKVRNTPKFRFDMIYQRNIGLLTNQEKRGKNTCLRNDFNMSGESFRLYLRYNIAPLWSAGIGTGVESYTEPHFDTFPVFATVRFSPFKLKSLYTFSDIGYAIKLFDKVTPGFTGKVGIGYTHLWARHFGLIVHIGYDLKSFRYHDYNYSADESTRMITITRGELKINWRHSLSIGVGLTF